VVEGIEVIPYRHGHGHGYRLTYYPRVTHSSKPQDNYILTGEANAKVLVLAVDNSVRDEEWIT